MINSIVTVTDIITEFRENKLIAKRIGENRKYLFKKRVTEFHISG